jgi:hypothetical protein
MPLASCDVLPFPRILLDAGTDASTTSYPSHVVVSGKLKSFGTHTGSTRTVREHRKPVLRSADAGCFEERALRHILRFQADLDITGFRYFRSAQCFCRAFKEIRQYFRQRCKQTDHLTGLIAVDGLLPEHKFSSRSSWQRNPTDRARLVVSSNRSASVVLDGDIEKTDSRQASSWPTNIDMK